MNFNNRIAADNLVKIDIPTIYELGAHWNGRIGWKNGVQIDVFTGIHEQHLVRLNYAGFEYNIPLVTTLCNYGGIRYWFECLFCKRRVGVIYLRADRFACRHCQFLTYESKLESKKFRKIISLPELEEAEEKVKRLYYNRKPTKNYIRFRKKEAIFASSMAKLTGVPEEQLRRQLEYL